MILTHLNLQRAGREATFVCPLARAQTSRHSSLIPIACCQRSAPVWLGNRNQKSSPQRFRAAASERGTHDQQAEAVGRTRSPISIARSLRAMSLSCSLMQTSSAMGVRAQHSMCKLGESNESLHTLNKKSTSPRKFADLLTADGRVEPSATTKPPTFDGRRTFGCAFNNALKGVLSNRVGGPT